MSIIENDVELAIHLAETAGQILKTVRSSKLIEGKPLGGAGDATANQFLIHALKHQRPDDGLLSEESTDDKARLEQSRVWIIDPVDGTREYGEERVDWAVHIGMAIDGVATIGAVALPGMNLVLDSDNPPALQPMPETPRMLVSRSRPAAEAVAVAEKIGAELVGMGSVGAKAMAVVRGEAEIYLHTGGQYEWDSCAPVAIAQAAGLHVTRVDGSPMRYNQEDVYLPDLLICRKEIADKVVAAIKTL